MATVEWKSYAVTTRRVDDIGRVISEIGRWANVVVNSGVHDLVRPLGTGRPRGSN